MTTWPKDNKPCQREHGAGCIWYIALFLAVMQCSDNGARLRRVEDELTKLRASEALERIKR